MAKATKLSLCPAVPARRTISEMIRRHAVLIREMNRLYDQVGDETADTPEYSALAREAYKLEPLIIATRATSRVERMAKMRFICKTDSSLNKLAATPAT